MKLHVTNLLLFLCFFPLYLLAQNNIYTLKDTALANRLLKENQYYFDKNDNAKHLEKSDSLCLLFEQIYGRESKQLAGAMASKGAALLRLNRNDESIATTEKCIEINTKLNGKMNATVAQNYAQLSQGYVKKAMHKKALEYMLIVLEIREKVLDKKDRLLLRTYSNMVIMYLNTENFEKALEYGQKSLNWLFQYDKENVIYIANIYSNMAIVYANMGQFSKSKEYNEKVLAVQLKVAPPTDLMRTYNNLGYLSNQIGDYDKALYYFNKVLNLWSNNPNIPKKDPESTYRNIGVSYYYKGEASKAIVYLRTAETLLNNNKGKEHSELSDFHSYMGLTYLKNNQIDSALIYLQKAVDLQLKVLSYETSDLAQYFINLGICYDKRQEYDNALAFFQKAENIYEKTFGKNNTALGQSYFLKGKTYFRKQAHEKSINYLEKVLLLHKFTLNKNFSGIEDLDLSEIIQSLKYLGLNYVAFYKKNNDIKYLELAETYLSEAIKGSNYHVEAINTEGSKNLQKKETYDIYESAIRINQLLELLKNKDSFIQKSFDYAEQSKAKTLQEQIQESRALSFEGIPDSVLQQEISLREYITYYEKQRQDSLINDRTETDSIILSISSKLFDVKLQYDSLKKDIALNYKEYYKLKYDIKTLSVADVQKSFIKDNQTLLEYFVGDSSIFIFTITTKDFKVTEVKNDFGLDSLVRLFRFGLTGFHLAEIKTDSLKNAAPIAYTEGGRKLYDKLIAPIKNQLKEHVIIVPDGILNYIPFEALLKERNEKPYRFKAHKYLIDDHQISYAYSATILSEMQGKQHKTPPTKNLLAFAPFTTQDTTILTDLTVLDTSEDTRAILKPLPASGQEVANIAALMKGNAYYDTTATEPLFAKLAPEYRIIHLSTHGSANDKMGDYSYLAFSEIKDSIENERLYARDLYNLQLNADMVVMSACETAIGELQRGEGMISLARAFTYSGAKSIVTTLWQVTDESSKTLMIDFYKFLNKGYTKVDALRRAKLRFIKRTDSNPFYWSGFIGMGDMRKL